jgi:hypothetical protein
LSECQRPLFAKGGKTNKLRLFSKKKTRRHLYQKAMVVFIVFFMCRLLRRLLHLTPPPFAKNAHGFATKNSPLCRIRRHWSGAVVAKSVKKSSRENRIILYIYKPQISHMFDVTRVLRENDSKSQAQKKAR